VSQDEIDRLVNMRPAELRQLDLASSSPESLGTSIDTEGPDPELLWDRDETLAYVYDFARARMVSPWALLGALLVRASCSIPPWVTIPPMIGSRASLNLYVALAGPPGTGKGASEAAARDAVRIGEIYEFTPGSGEGVAHVYRERVTEDKQQVLKEIRNTALCSIPEVDLLTALGGRQGATLMPVLRSGWSGERLGNANASKDRTVPVEAHTYRLGLILGVQPARAGALLDDADGGTPQRFLWFPTLDPGAPDETPPRYDIKPPEIDASLWKRGDIALPAIIWDTVQDSQRMRLRGVTAALDGHATLARIKATVALAVLCGQRVVTEHHWDTAGLLMAKSDETRAWVQEVLSEENKRRRHDQAVADALHEDTKNDVLESRARERLTKWVARTLRIHGEMGSAALRKKAAGRDRGLVDTVLDDLVGRGAITARIDTYNGQEATFYSLQSGVDKSGVDKSGVDKRR